MERGLKRKLDLQTDDEQEVGKMHPQLADSNRSTALSQIELLPTEILIKIIRYLPISQWASLEGISTTLRDSTYEAWKTLKATNVYDDLLASPTYFGWDGVFGITSEMVMEKLTTRAINLTSVSGMTKLYGWCRSDYIFWDLEKFSKLRHLHLAGVLVDAEQDHGNTEEQARDLLFRRSVKSENHRRSDSAKADPSDAAADSSKEPMKLESICLENNLEQLLFGQDVSFSPWLMQTMDVTNLTSFCVLNSIVPPQKLTFIIDRAVNLKALRFSFCCLQMDETANSLCTHDVSSNSIQIARDQNAKLLTAIGRLSCLEELDIGVIFGSFWNCGCRNFADELATVVRAIGERHDKDGKRVFKEIGLHGYAAVPEHVKMIAEYLPDLQSLRLEVHHLDNDTLRRVLRSQTKLRSLSLTNGYNRSPHCVAIEDILLNSSTIESLNIVLPSELNIPGDLKALAQCGRLSHFWLALGGSRPSAKVDDSVLGAWAQGFGSKLLSFKLTGKFSLTDEGIKRFLTNTPRLEILRLDVWEVTDSFSKSCHLYARTLRIYICSLPIV